MRRFPKFNLRRRWPLLVLCGTAAGAVTIGALRLQSLAQQLLPGFLHSRLQASLGRPVTFGAVHLTPTGLWVDNLRVPAQKGEAADPITAKTVNVAADWLALLTRRQVVVSAVTLHGAALKITAQPHAKPWTSQVVALGGSGIPRFALDKGAVQLLTPAGKPEWSAERVDGGFSVQPASFEYDTRIGSLETGGVHLASLELAGSGDNDSATLRQGSLEYAGGRLSGAGKIDVAGNSSDLEVRVERMPLGQIATRVGIPADWAVQGTLTGALKVRAEDNALQAIHGTVNVARGSLARKDGQFPWQSAEARIDWTPEGAQISGIKVQGEGVQLTADGKVDLPPGQPLTEGDFNLSGRVHADRNGSVAQVAELLAFRHLLEGRWEAGDAQVDFQAHGKVGHLEQAGASGKLVVENLRFRPLPDQEASTVDRLEADVERTGDRLVLRNVNARTEGFDVTAEGTLTDDRPGHPSEFSASGAVDVKDMKSLRRALPQAALWRWIPIASPNASGRVEFKLGGPTANPAALWSDGKFEARDFRFSAPSTLPSGAIFFIPIKTASGSFHHAEGQFRIPDLSLEAPSFTAKGLLALDLKPAEPVVESDLNLSTDDWRSLPAMASSAIPELTGGHMEAHLHLVAPASKLSHAPVDGSFVLTNASYQPGRDGATPLPVQEFGAQFHWSDRVLNIAQLDIKTPLLIASAQGRVYPVDRKYRIGLEVKASTPDPGDLAARFSSEVLVSGGSAEARVQLDAPVEHLMDGSISGNLDLRGVTVKRAVPELGLDQLEARALAVEFARSPEAWQVSRLTLDSPALTANVAGVVGSDHVDAQLQVRMDGWSAPKGLPITGGAVDLSGHLTGRIARPETLGFHGDVKLRDASVRLANETYALDGGRLSLEGAVNGPITQPEQLSLDGKLELEGAHARYAHGDLNLREAILSGSATGNGPLLSPLEWLRSGKVQVTGADLAVGKRDLPRIERVAADFVREGERIRWTQGEVTAAGSKLTSTGWWSPKAHSADVTASLHDLAPFGLKLPAGVSLKDSQLALHVDGTPDQPVAAATGTAKLEGVKLAADGLPALALDRLDGAFRLDNGLIRIESLEGQGPAGKLTAQGTWSEKEQHLTLAAQGPDLTRLGLDLPEGFRVRGWEIHAEANGDAQRPLNRFSGTVKLAETRFPFGPEGPHRLDALSASFTGAREKIQLTNIAADGPAGHYTGSGEITPKGYRVALDVPSMDPAVVRWLLPGKMMGGALSGTLTLAGNDKDPVTLAEGRFDLKNSSYVGPKELGVSDAAMPLNRFTGDYRWDNGKTTLRNLTIESPLFTATGALTATETAGEATADLKTGDVGKVADFWPVLVGRMEGGTGTGHLQAQFTDKTFRGTLAMAGKGGEVVLPGVDGPFARHPVETASLTLGFEPSKLTFQGVKLRGPKGNADGEGSWTPDGPVFGQGKAWFSKSFTSKLMPKGLGWLAKLAGVKEIKSDFTLTGSADQVTLNAAITRSFLWKFAKGSVPKDFQEVAKGKAPLWVKPLDVAEAPTTGSTAGAAPPTP